MKHSDLSRMAVPSRRGHRSVALLAGVGAAAVALALPGGASAAGGTWNCSASAVRATLVPNTPIEPLIANQDQPACASDTLGVSNLGGSTDNLVGGAAVEAKTTVNTAVAPAAQLPTSYASVTNLKLTGAPSFTQKNGTASTTLLELPGTISSQVSGVCSGGQPKLTATSTSVPLKIGGMTIPTDKPVTETLTGAGKLTGAVLSIEPAEQVQTATSLTRRGLHVTLRLGSVQIVDLVAAESTVNFTSNPCANTTTPPLRHPISRRKKAKSRKSRNAAYLRAMRRAGYDRFGLRIVATHSFGKRSRVRIACWRGHHGACRGEIVVYRAHDRRAIKVGWMKITMRHGRIRTVMIRTKRFPRKRIRVIVRQTR